MKISVTIPKDENGLIGRECLKCKRYFKIKEGTGLDTTHCHCPYCDYNGDYDNFWTESQIEYAKSVALKQVYDQLLQPALDKMVKSFKQLEYNSRNSLIKFKVDVSGNKMNFPIKYYKERELETIVHCRQCGLVFSVTKEFNNCPDCNRTNADQIFETAMELIKKRVKAFTKKEVPQEMQQAALSSSLNSIGLAFVKFGNQLIEKKPKKYLNFSKGLFGNPLELDNLRNGYFSKSFNSYSSIIKLFELKRVFESNGGVIDNEACKMSPELEDYLGRKYEIEQDEILKFIEIMHEFSIIVLKDFDNNQLGIE